MSVASEFAPDVYIPRQARTYGSSALALDPCPEAVPARPRHLQVVQPAPEWSDVTTTPLRRPSLSLKPQASPLHLTRRGMAAVAGAAIAVSAALVVLAWQFGPSQSAAPTVGSGVTDVSVRPGDTLWSIASRVAPQRDPRAEVADIQRLNDLSSTDLVAGQSLRVR